MCKIIAWWNRGFTIWRNTIPILAFSCMECKCFFSKCLVWSSWSYPIRRSIRSSSYVLDSEPVSLPRSPLPPSLHPPLSISLSLHPHHSHLCQPGPLALLPVLSSFKWNGFMALNHVELHSETLVHFLWILPREKYRVSADLSLTTCSAPFSARSEADPLSTESEITSDYCLAWLPFYLWVSSNSDSWALVF